MLRLSFMPANPARVRACLVRSGLATGASAVITAASLIDFIRRTFPEHVLRQLPNYEQFIYMALAISLAFTAPLTAFRKVIWVSIAEMGSAAALLYLAYSLYGVFLPGYRLVFLSMYVLVLLGMVFMSLKGMAIVLHERSWSDLGAEILLLVVFVLITLGPLLNAWGYV